MDKIREAEDAEMRGEMPRDLNTPQKITRPTIDVSTKDRQAQVKATGLVPGMETKGVDIRRALSRLPAFMPGTNLDEVWDDLNESQKLRAGGIERFRMELEVCLEESVLEHQIPHQLGGRLNARNLDRCRDNLLAEATLGFGHRLAPDSAALLEDFIRSTSTLISTCLKQNQIAGITSKPLYDILRDWTQKLLYQELVNRVRGMGDRGIRRIVNNIQVADGLYQQLKRTPEYSPRQALLMRLIHIHQDLGHTAYAARTSYRGSKLHRAYSARIFSDELNRYRALFNHNELETARFAIATHSASEFPLGESTVLALVRMVDHLAPFGRHRAWLHLENVPGSHPYLQKMISCIQTEDLDAYGQVKTALHQFLLEAGIDPWLSDDILFALRPFERLASILNVGPWTGQLGELELQTLPPPGGLRVSVGPNRFISDYQGLFEDQQEQLLRLFRDYAIAPTQPDHSQKLFMQKEESAYLEIGLG